MAAQLNDFADNFVAGDYRRARFRPRSRDPGEIAAAHAAVRDAHQHLVVASFVDGNGAGAEQA
jgi:hypothetical protein